MRGDRVRAAVKARGLGALLPLPRAGRAVPLPRAGRAAPLELKGLVEEAAAERGEAEAMVANQPMRKGVGDRNLPSRPRV